MILVYLENIEVSLNIKKRQNPVENIQENTSNLNLTKDSDSENRKTENNQHKDNNRTAWENLAKSS